MLKRKNGYILLDICIAAIFSASLAALVAGYGIIARLQKAAEAELTAAFLAQEQIARVEEKGKGFLLAQSSCEWLGNNSDLSRNGNDYEVQTNIITSGFSAEMRNIIVRIVWTTDKGLREHVAERLIYVADY